MQKTSLLHFHTRRLLAAHSMKTGRRSTNPSNHAGVINVTQVNEQVVRRQYSPSATWPPRTQHLQDTPGINTSQHEYKMTLSFIPQRTRRKIKYIEN